MEILMEGSKSFGMNCYSPRQPKQNSLQNALRQNKRQHLCESGQASTYFKFRYTYIYLHFESRKVHLLIVLVVDVRKGSLLWTSLNLRSFILSCIYMYCIIYICTHRTYCVIDYMSSYRGDFAKTDCSQKRIFRLEISK